MIDAASALARTLTDLPDEQRRRLNALMMSLGTRFVADSQHLDGYRELAAKLADAEARASDSSEPALTAAVEALSAQLGETTRLMERERILGLIEEFRQEVLEGSFPIEFAQLSILIREGA